MASSTGPDLDVARVQVERLMDDSCVITRDPLGTDDSVFNSATGSLTAPAGQPTTVYSAATTGSGGRSLADAGALGGKCKVSPITESQPRLIVEGGANVLPRPYRFAVPWDAPLPLIGDLITITSSRRDPELVNTEFIVKDVMEGTFLVSRRMIVERRQ